MAKRSNFDRFEKDRYLTIDPRAGDALAPYIEDIETYAEPCVGDFDLVEQLYWKGKNAVWTGDIETGQDALDLSEKDLNGVDAIITNPPWSRPILHKMILHFSSLRPTWLLFDAGWMFTKQSKDYIGLCTDIVPVGRLRWIPNTTMQGKDDCAWYKFDKTSKFRTVFHGRK